MRVLLVEPNYRKSRKNTSKSKPGDETLWYPPLGLLKIARFHIDRGDEVRFIQGCDKSILPRTDIFDPIGIWDRIYITTLFTFDFDKVVATVEFYKKAVGGTRSKIFIGGIMASLMPRELASATGIFPHIGLLHSPNSIGLDGDIDIDALDPEYSILDSSKYAVNDTYYAYTSRGCINKCSWCGVPSIEPTFTNYIDIKLQINASRTRFGDKPILKLMDNNILASPKLDKVVADLIDLGYGLNCHTRTQPPKQRVIDFNQGLDSSFLTAENVALISHLNIRPLRVAFDRLEEREVYQRALELAHEAGFPEFSNYMLYNYQDTPYDLFERLMLNIKLNEVWAKDSVPSKIYSYPMRYAPINDLHGNRSARDMENTHDPLSINWRTCPVWTKRFARNIEIMKGAAHGAISSTPGLARRTIGATFEEFMGNLYMPESLLRNRAKHEKKTYNYGGRTKPGSGRIEAFRDFLRQLLFEQNQDFYFFHNAVAQNSTRAINEAISECKQKEIRKWLQMYLRSES
jgi:hypothetical protein